MTDQMRAVNQHTRRWLGKSAFVALPYGDIADRLSIALLKLVKANPRDFALAAQLHYVAQFSDVLMSWVDSLEPEQRKTFLNAFAGLREANGSLWAAEDAVRELRVKAGDGTADVVKMAMQIATLNDTRNQHKRTIDAMCGQAGDFKHYWTGASDGGPEHSPVVDPGLRATADAAE